jgi:hypothetical protein
MIKPELTITSYISSSLHNSRLHNWSFQPAGLHFRDEQREQAPAGRQQHHHDAHRQAKPNHANPNQTKSNQTKPNQTKPTKPYKTKSNQTKPNQIKLNQTKPNQTKSNQIKTNKKNNKTMQTKPHQPNQTKPKSRIIHIVVYVVFQAGFYKIVKNYQLCLSELSRKPFLN